MRTEETEARLHREAEALARVPHPNIAARVAVSPDGRWLLSTNWNGSLNLWDGSSTP